MFLPGALATLWFSTLTENFSRHLYSDLICSWLLGVCLGSWTAQIPRQLVSVKDSKNVRFAVTIAPFLGSSFGAFVLVILKISVSSFCLVLSFLFILFYLWAISVSGTSEVSDKVEDSEMESTEDFEAGNLNQRTVPVQSYSEMASSHVLNLGVLASLCVDRCVRTLVALEVVSFFPVLWGEDFFLLSLGSIVALFLGVVVPSWCSALVGCISLYLLGGPGLIVWIWVEASCRNDLMRCSEIYAANTDTILFVADALAALLFAFELTESPSERPVGVSYLSGFLLLASSIGRLLASKL